MVLKSPLNISESSDPLICTQHPSWSSTNSVICTYQESQSSITPEDKLSLNTNEVPFVSDSFETANYKNSVIENVLDESYSVDPLGFGTARDSHDKDFVDALTLELENLSDSRVVYDSYSTTDSSPMIIHSRANASLLNTSNYPLLDQESYESTSSPTFSPVSTICSTTLASTSLIRKLSRGAVEKIGNVHNSLTYHDSDGSRGTRSILGRKRGKESVSNNISRRQSIDSVSSPGPLTRHKGGLIIGSPVSSSPQSGSPFFRSPDCSPFLSSSSLSNINIPPLNLNQEKYLESSSPQMMDSSQLTDQACSQSRSPLVTISPFASKSVLPMVNQIELKEPPKVPNSLQTGVTFLRLTHKKKIQRTFRINPESGVLSWNSKASSKLFIDKIYEIRVGADARNYREEFNVSSELEHRWATIIYSCTNHKLKALHFVAPTRKEFDTFIEVLGSLFQYRQEIMSGLAMPGEKFVNTHWNSYVIKDDGEERLSFESVEKLTRGLHVNCSKKYLRDMFIEADVDHSGFLNFTEFQEFVKLLKTRREVAEIFFKLLGIDVTTRRKSIGSLSQTKEPHKLILPTDLVSFSKFRHFIKYTQKDDFDDHTIERIFRKFAKITSEEYAHTGTGITDNDTHSGSGDKLLDVNKNFMSFEAFSEFLNSSYAPLCAVHKEDLSHPLNEYFISSSHNTYLMGRQVGGTSTIEGYIRALQRGCRCVEIDCWDGVNGPVVNHGRTFTSSIEFADVISTIRKYAFISSPFPLILSLEVHCNFENQLKMVETMHSILAERLVVAPISSDSNSLPSPLELKHRILIKVKSGADVNIADAATFGSATFSNINSKDLEFISATDSGASGLSEEFSVFSDETNDYVGKRRTKKKLSNRVICKPLGDLGVYAYGLKFRNFSLPESKTYNHIFSLSERIFNSMSKDPEKRKRIEKHNRKFLMRVYPAGYRVTSNNFSPCVYWQGGVQMVALNWQTYDLGVQINHAMFEVGDRSGYVLKPAGLRPPSIKNPISEETLASPRIMTKGIKVSIDIISAQQLPRAKDLKADEPFCPYIIMEIFGPTSDTLLNSTTNPPYSASSNISSHSLPGVSSSFPLSRIRSKSGDKTAPSRKAPAALGRWKTPLVQDNGFNPIWNCKYNISVERSNYDFAFVRFSVCSGDNAFAVNTIRLKSLNQGYRHVPLNDLQGEEYIFSTLFIKSGITD